MTLKRIELTGSFTATDERGRPHTILAFIDILDAGTEADPHDERPGRRSFQVETRRGLDDVTRLGKGLYRMSSGRRLRSECPDAP